VTVLAEYREHGRLHVGLAADILEDAAHACLHDQLNGQDTLLMAGADGMAAELSRRVRDDLIAGGLVSDSPTVHLRDGAVASVGDWIMARRNLNSIDAGEPGRSLADQDILRITNPGAGLVGIGVEVRRLADRGPDTGPELWSAPFLLSRAYLRNDVQLAYAVNFHAAEGQTVDSGSQSSQARRPAGGQHGADPWPEPQRGVGDRRVANRRPCPRPAACRRTGPARSAGRRGLRAV